MSRSFKKAFVTVSKKWDRYKEKRFRVKAKAELLKIEKEVAFEPDTDFEILADRTSMGSWGTKFGLEFDDLKWLDDTDAEEWKEDRDRMRRK